jgi:anti-sigma factor RsiW
MADLSALADGTLAPERRADVEARIAASAELQELLDRQRRSLSATQALVDEPVPPSLSMAVADAVARPPVGADSPPRRRRRTVLGLAGLGAVVAVAAAVLVLTLGGGRTPSLNETAQLAVRAPSGPAPAALAPAGTELAASVQGVTFPDLAGAFGWRASGVRHGSVSGRDVTVVSYTKGSRRISYAIVAGEALPRPSSGTTSILGGVRYQTLSLDGRLAVTWRRGGHTCLLIGSAPPSELLAVASWSSGYPAQS